MGSDSDYPTMEESCKVLEQFDTAYEILVTSAHRSPGRTQTYIREAKKRGIKVLIAGAGGAAHLAGVLAAETVLPVVGVPIPSTPLKGLDSLLSINQMPAGVPVATMAIGKAGARNAGLLAVQILALSDAKLTVKLQRFKKKAAREVEIKDQKLQSSHAQNR
ncbi:MAG: 5-(carboxyamino)imidazole ribonucleotide mutase [Nitrospinales bacterium]